MIEDSIFKRGLATSIDIMLLNGLVLFVALPVEEFLGLERTSLTEAVTILVVTAAYFVGLWTLTGQTIGKKLFRLRVIQTDGYPLSLERALIRYGGYVMMTLPFFLGFFLSAFLARSNRGRQGLHDALAGTIVVRTR